MSDKGSLAKRKWADRKREPGWASSWCGTTTVTALRRLGTGAGMGLLSGRRRADWCGFFTLSDLGYPRAWPAYAPNYGDWTEHTRKPLWSRCQREIRVRLLFGQEGAVVSRTPKSVVYTAEKLNLSAISLNFGREKALEADIVSEANMDTMCITDAHWAEKANIYYNEESTVCPPAAG